MCLFENNPGKTEMFLEKLCKHGPFLASGGRVYFSSEEKGYTAASVKKALKESGFAEFFVMQYDRNSLPKDDDNVVYGWLTDHIVKNATLAYERDNQKQLRDISSKLDDATEKIKQAGPLPDGNGGVNNGSKQ